MSIINFIWDLTKSEVCMHVKNIMIASTGDKSTWCMTLRVLRSRYTYNFIVQLWGGGGGGGGGGGWRRTEPGLEIRLMFWSDIARTQYKTLWSCMGNLIGHFDNLVGKCPMTSCYF